MRRLCFACCVLVWLALPALASAEYAAPTPHDRLLASNVGFRFSIAPGIYIPLEGSVGFSLVGQVRYGFPVGSFVLAPGVRPSLYFSSDSTIVLGLGTLRTTWIVDRVAPFVEGGIGPGYVSDPSQVGLGYVAGGGLMVLLGERFGLGVEASYQGITSTNFKALFIGPTFMLLL